MKKTTMKQKSLKALSVALAISACASVGYARPAELSTTSPLYPLMEQAIPHFDCPGGNCQFVLSDRTGPDGSCQEPKIPRIPGNPNPSMEEFCAYHQGNTAEQWNIPFDRAYPLSTAVPNGELIGCIVGNNLFAQEARLLPGWQGKGYNAETGVFTNLVRLGMLNDTSSYPGKFYPDYDPVEGVSWKLDYGVQTNIPIIGGAVDWMIDNLMPGRYIRNMGGFEDHMRELAPGVWMGEVYARPFMLSWDLAFGNLSPFTVNVGVPFIMFQSCGN